MSKTYHPFQTEHPAADFVRSLAGVAVALVLLAIALAIFFINPSPTEEDQASVSEYCGFYLSASGSGDLLHLDEGVWKDDVAEGDDLRFGTAYRNSPGSRVLLRSTRRKLAIVLDPGCAFRLGAAEEGPSLHLSLGSMTIRLLDFETEVPLVLGVRDCTVTLNSRSCVRLIADAEEIRAQVHEGVAAFEGPGSSQQLAAGSEVRVAGGNVHYLDGRFLPIPAPQKPLTGGVVSGNERVEFSWEAVGGARGYRVEIAKDVLFSEGVIPRNVSRNALSYSIPEDGKYYWRVKAVRRENDQNEASWPQLITVRTQPVPQEEIPPPPDLMLYAPPEARRNVIIIRGKTDPTATVVIRFEIEGETIAESAEGEIEVNSEGDFRYIKSVRRRGFIKIFVSAYYRPESRKDLPAAEVWVDF